MSNYVIVPINSTAPRPLATSAVPTAQIDGGGTLTDGTVVAGIIYCLSPTVAGEIVPFSDLAATHITSILGVGRTDGKIDVKINNSGAVNV